MTTLDPMPPKRQNQKPRVFLSEKEKKKATFGNKGKQIKKGSSGPIKTRGRIMLAEKKVSNTSGKNAKRPGSFIRPTSQNKSKPTTRTSKPNRKNNGNSPTKKTTTPNTTPSDPPLPLPPSTESTQTPMPIVINPSNNSPHALCLATARAVSLSIDHPKREEVAQLLETHQKGWVEQRRFRELLHAILFS